jgi:hypothetical protein
LGEWNFEPWEAVSQESAELRRRYPKPILKVLILHSLAIPRQLEHFT